MKKAAFILIALLCLTWTVVALAADGYDLWWSVMGGGGGRVRSGAFTLDGTLGQPVAGGAALESFLLCSGYWCEPLPPPPPRFVYIPLVGR